MLMVCGVFIHMCNLWWVCRVRCKAKMSCVNHTYSTDTCDMSVMVSLIIISVGSHSHLNCDIIKCLLCEFMCLEACIGPWCLSSINIVGYFCISSVSRSLSGNAGMFMWSSSIGCVPWVRPGVTWVVAVHHCHGRYHDTGHCSNPDIAQYSYPLEGHRVHLRLSWWHGDWNWDLAGPEWCLAGPCNVSENKKYPERRYRVKMGTLISLCAYYINGLVYLNCCGVMKIIAVAHCCILIHGMWNVHNGNMG